jgi:hypothetical protein
METTAERNKRSERVYYDELDALITEEVLERLRADMGKILVPIMKEGREAGRKWALEEATFDQLYRIHEHSDEDYVNLDNVSDTRPLYSSTEPSLGDIIGGTTPETLEYLIDPNADEDQRGEFWRRRKAFSYQAWFALGFIHGAAEIFEHVAYQLH